MRRVPAIWIASAAIAFSLSLPLAGGVAGRFLLIRVLLVGALVLLIGAASRSQPVANAQRLVTVALGLLMFAAALVIRGITPTGIALLSISIGCLWWQRRAWRAL